MASVKAAAGGKRKSFSASTGDGWTGVKKSKVGDDRGPKKWDGPKQKNGFRGDHKGKGAAVEPAGKTFEKGQTSRESHAKQKQLALERRASKPLADEVHRTKQLWEKLRRKSHVPKPERDVMVEELFGIITGRVKEFVLRHDSVRVIQTAVKYANAERRRSMARELQGTFAQMAESKYAKFLIAKLIVQGDDEMRDMIVPEFYGRVRKMINHAEASWILDDIYRQIATKKQKAVLLREWYGPDLSLLGAPQDDATADLAAIVTAEPSKKEPTLKFLLAMCNQLIQKQMTGFTMLHDAMLQYYLNVAPGSEAAAEFMEIVKGDEHGDLLKNMAFTKSGARLSCLLLAHGSAKDRKHLIRAIKESIPLMASDAHGHLVILACYDVIDDTVMTAKTIFPELLGKDEDAAVENVIQHVGNINARTTLQYLLDGPSRALFPASLAADLEVLREVHEIRAGTSKKDADVRRGELVAALSPQLLRAVVAAPATLVSTSFGCQFVTDVVLSASGDKTDALGAIAATAAGDPSRTQAEVEDVVVASPHIAQTAHGASMLRTLVAGGRFDKAAGQVRRVDPPLNFADILYPVIEEHILDWATGPSSFVVLNLLNAEDFSSRDALEKVLKKHKKELVKAATATGEAKLDKSEKANGKSKTKGKASEKDGGNIGARLLLEKL